MSAAGAPPPPPSPPPPPPPSPPPSPLPHPSLDRSRSYGPFGGLPAELILVIIEELSHDDYLNFAVAIYPTLRVYGLVPELTDQIYQDLIQQASHMTSPSQDQRERQDGSLRLPLELHDRIMDYLQPQERIAWIFSHRQLFRTYFEGLSDESRRSLAGSVREERKGKGKSRGK